MITKSPLTTILRCFYSLLALLAVRSSEGELMMKSSYFRTVSWSNGTRVCAVDRESATYTTTSVVSCSNACKNFPGCGNFNYDAGKKTCSVFTNRPKCYGFASATCYHYEVRFTYFLLQSQWRHLIIIIIIILGLNARRSPMSHLFLTR